MLCGDLNGKDVQKGGYISKRMADSFYCKIETNTNCKATVLQ